MRHSDVFEDLYDFHCSPQQHIGLLSPASPAMLTLTQLIVIVISRFIKCYSEATSAG